MQLCGWTTRRMFDRYNIVAARDLEEGVARLTEYLKRTKRDQTRDERQRAQI